MAIQRSMRPLILEGADVNGLTQESGMLIMWNPLEEAMRAERADIIELLTVHGADINVRDARGDAPLHTAARTGDSELAKLLLDRDAKIDERDGEGNTPLHWAARQGKKGTLQLLVAHGGDINARNWRAMTPLHYAASQGHREIILLLLANGASVNAQDKHGDTPLHAAAVRGHKEVVELLVRHGADLQAKDNDGLTAKDRAARRRQKDVIPLLTTQAGVSGNGSRNTAETRVVAPKQVSAEPGETPKTPVNDPNLVAFRVQRVQLSESAQARRDGKDLVRANSAFAVDLYRQLSGEKGNVFFSPYSISVALAMTFAAARENTEKEMAKTLHFSLEQKGLHPAVADLQGVLDKVQNTEDAPFYVTGTATVKTPMMRQTEEVRYGEAQGLQILELMYRGRELSVLVLLPRERDGLGQVEEKLSVEGIELWRQRLVQRKVVIYLPKFRVTVTAELKETLQKMGMVDAFEFPGANFAGLDGDPDWFYIGAVVHKAFVDVNEEGTEAAAATAVVMGMGGMPPPPVFRADHPFLFLIQENSTGSIFFMGRISDPTQTGQ